MTSLLKKSSKTFELLISTSRSVRLAGGAKLQSETVYQFSHISFQEYFCATELLERLQMEVNRNGNGIVACKKIFLNNPEIKGGTILHNFWWSNVLYFAANAAPPGLFKDMTEFLLKNDDESASNATLCYDLAKLRGEPMDIPRIRAIGTLRKCLTSHSVEMRRLALAEIQISNAYKVDVINSLVKLLAEDATGSKNELQWYEKIACVDSLVCLDAALFCVVSNRTMHVKIVEVLTMLLSNRRETGIIKSLILESLRTMGLQHEPIVRKTLARLLQRKDKNSIKVLIRMISKMNIVDSHILCIIASNLNDPDLREVSEEALNEIVVKQIWTSGECFTREQRRLSVGVLGAVEQRNQVRHPPQHPIILDIMLA